MARSSASRSSTARSSTARSGTARGANSATRSARRNSPARNDAVELLKSDHRQVEDWFEQFEKARSDDRKQDLVMKIFDALRVHTAIEEEIFYPAFYEATQEEDLHHEAIVEHDGAKKLMAEIESSGPENEYYDARVKVLSEMIKHHVKEEEQRDGMFAKARSSDMDLVAVGEQLAARKAELEVVTRRDQGSGACQGCRQGIADAPDVGRLTQPESGTRLLRGKRLGEVTQQAGRITSPGAAVHAREDLRSVSRETLEHRRGRRANARNSPSAAEGLAGRQDVGLRQGRLAGPALREEVAAEERTRVHIQHQAGIPSRAAGAACRTSASRAGQAARSRHRRAPARVGRSGRPRRPWPRRGCKRVRRSAQQRAGR